MNRELIYNLIYFHCDLPVSPHGTHHIHHDIHDTYICQIFDSHKKIKSIIWFYLHCDLPVSPPCTHHIHHDIYDTYICQIFDSHNVNWSNLQLFCVWKHVFGVDETLEILIQNSSRHTLQCAMTSQKKNSLRRPRGATRNLNCFCFCSLFLKGHHCGNKFFPISVSAILACLQCAHIWLTPMH